jgi:hypothetical protein
MIHNLNSLVSGPRLAVLSSEIDVRVLNSSSSGCLCETTSCIEIGTVGTLRLRLHGEELSEQVQVVRCQKIAGAGSVHHVAVKFLWTEPPANGSLRLAMRDGARGLMRE